MEVPSKSKNCVPNSFAILALILVAFVFNATAQTTAESFPNLKRNIDTFLTEWLIRKNNKRSFRFFTEKAFSNKEMLNESCLGIKHTTPNQIKKGVKKFLSEFSNHDKTDRRLSERLTKGNDTDFAREDEFKNAAISLPQETKYWLFRSTPKIVDGVIGDSGRTRYLKKYFKGKKIAMHIGGIKFDDGDEEVTGHFYFFWILENNDWKILHAGMYCV